MNDNDTRNQLEEERRIINAATAGPWELDEEGGIQGARPGMYPDPELDPMVGRLNEPEDNEFAVYARTALPLRNAQVEAVLAKCDEITKDGEELMAEWHERGEESDEIELLSQGADLVEMARVIRRAIEEAGA